MSQAFQRLDMRRTRDYLCHMTAAPALGNYLISPPALFTAKQFAEERQEITHRFLAEAFAQAVSFRRVLSQQQGLFDDFYRKVEASDDPPMIIEDIADIAHDCAERNRTELAADFEEIAAKVKLYRKSRDPNAQSMARLGEEIFALCAAWYDLYQNFEIRLRKLASDRDPAPSEVFANGAAAIQYLRSAAKG